MQRFIKGFWQSEMLRKLKMRREKNEFGKIARNAGYAFLALCMSGFIDIDFNPKKILVPSRNTPQYAMANSYDGNRDDYIIRPPSQESLDSLDKVSESVVAGFQKRIEERNKSSR